MLKKLSIYLFPFLTYCVFHILLSQLQLAWWDRKQFDDSFYLMINAVLLMNILIIYLWQKNLLGTNPFDFSGTKWWHFLITLGLGGLVFIFGLNSSRWFSLPVTTNTNSLNTLLAYSNGKLYLEGFLLWNVLLGPIREEFFHRMLLMETYFKASPYYLDVLLSASVFAASHILPEGNFQAFWIYAIPGALYAITYRLTRNIYWPIVIHVIWNGYVYVDLIGLVIV